MRLVANILSGMFHPLLMPAYGVGMALSFTYLRVFPFSLKSWILATVVALTVLVPALVVIGMKYMGMARDWDLTDRRERTVPYLVYATSLLATAFFLFRLMMPVWVVAPLLGACGALVILMLVNLVWKISAHATGSGGLVGGIMGVSILLGINPWALLSAAFLVAGVVGSSRLLLGRHTPMQVYAGFCLGFVCVFMALIW